MSQLENHGGSYCTSATVWHELSYGIERLADSKQKASLSKYLQTLLNNGLIVLPFDQRAGEWLAQQRAILSKSGINIPYSDGEIAAVAATNDLTIVTRNTPDFAMYRNLLVENWFK